MGVAQRLERHGGVERLHLARAVAGRPLHWASVHLVDGVLVDTGPASARAALVRFLRGREVTDVLTTHEHEDHIGNHAVLPPGVAVHAPPLALRFLERGHDPFPLYRRVVWGAHEPAPGARPLGERVDAGGRRFRVIPSPGHSADHVAFLDEQSGALWSGDAYMGKFRAARDAEDVRTEARTLRALADLDPAVLYPAHGPVVERPRARLLDVAEHFEALARRAWALRDKGWSVRRVRRELLGREPPLFYVSMGEFSADKLVANLLRERP